MNKFKQVALKAKKELENHKKQVCLLYMLLADSLTIKLLNEIASFILLSFHVQWKDEKDELTSTIQELREDAQTLNAKFVEQQEETLKQGNEYQV